MKKFKTGNVILSMGIAFFIFVGIYFTEQSRFKHNSKLENPFSKDLTQEIKDFETKAEEQVIFTSEGEFFYIAPETKLDFEGKNRILVQGEIIYNGGYLSDDARKKALKNFKAPFDLQESKPLIGQIQIDNLVISNPLGTMAIKDNILQGSISVYAYDHPVYILFPEAQKPFILPSQSQVTIRKSGIKRYGKLFYTKQKKELQMKFASDLDSNFDLSMEKALAIQTPIKERIDYYAQEEIFKWSWFRPSSSMGRITRFFKYLQRHFAIGYSENKKKAHQFQSMVNDLICIFHLHTEGRISLAKPDIIDFTAKVQTTEWKKFMIENPNFKSKWDTFKQAQVIYLRTLHPEEEVLAFNSVFFPEQKENSLENLEFNFQKAESYIAQGFISKAREVFIKISKDFKNIPSESISSQNIDTVTRLRRLVLEILRQKDFIEQPDIFLLYKQLIQKELEIYEDRSSFHNEISLESAQDILYFLQSFIDKDTENEIIQILIETYKILDIDNITQRIGRNIFTDKEKDTIRKVQYLNNQTFSTEEIESVEAQYLELETLQKELARLENLEQKEKEEEASNSYGIQTPKDLKAFLVSTTFNTKKVQVKASKDLLVFQNMSTKGLPIEGVFDPLSQSFTNLKVGNGVEKGDYITINTDIFARIVNDLSKRNNTKRKSITPSQDTDIVSESSFSLIQKTLISKKLSSQGIEAEKNNITTKNASLGLYSVSEANFGDSKISFIYDQKNNKIKDLMLQIQKQKFEIPTENLTIESLQKRLKAFAQSQKK